MKRRPLWVLALLLLLLPGVAVGHPVPSDQPRTVDAVLARYMDKVESRLQPRFQFAGLEWPPKEVFLVALKDVRRLELWARSDAEWNFIRDYRIKGMSGTVGPKLKRGDRQVPEGLYRIERLNPNSAFHLSLKINYPNAVDREQARREGRGDLGGDIFIHGKNVSTGCLAMGDNAIEELFVLTGLLGKEHVSVLIAPRDYRWRSFGEEEGTQPAWVRERNRHIAVNLMEFRQPRREP